ncbi:MAG: FHA domain-containing protein [Tetrasphaera sp.]
MTRWLPGTDHGLAWPGGLALIDGGLDAAVVDSLWQALADGADIAGFLDALTHACGHSLISLPGFAIAFVAPDSTTVAARGHFAVTAQTSRGTEFVDGSGASIWAERHLSVATAVALTHPGRSAHPDHGGRPIVSGVLTAGALSWGDASAEAGQPAPAVAAAADPGTDAASASASSGHPDSPDTGPTPAAASTATPAAQDAPVGETGGVTLEPDWERVPELARHLWLVPEPAVARAPADASAVSSTSPPDKHHVAAVELARAVHHPSVGEHAPAAAPAAAADADGFISVVPAFPRSYVPPPAMDARVDIVEVPSGRRDSRLEEPRSSHSDTADTADVTRRRAELTSPVHLVPGREAPAAVLGVFCPAGHANPPQRSLCRVCRAAIDGVPRQIPQPNVGRLVASTGEAFDLSGTVIAGRAPRASAGHAGSPRLLALPYGHISGSHLEIRVEGWSILAQDLSSTNGTFLRRGTQPPVRLPEVPIPIFQGDTLDFGDGVRITFENLP